MTAFTFADDFATTPARLGEVLTSQELVAARANVAGKVVQVPSVNVAADGSATLDFTVTITPDMLPAKVQKFVSSERVVTIKETWSAPAADGTRTGTVHVQVEKPTVVATANTRIEATADGARRVIEGDLDVKIPLVGGTFEKQALARAPRALARDVALINSLI